MNEHTRAQAHLYDFVKEELYEQARTELEKHIASCKECSEEVKSLSIFLQEFDRTTVEWSAQQPTEYWKSFENIIDARIKREEQKPRSIAERFAEWFDGTIAFRPRDIAIAGSVCAVLLIAVIVGKQFFFEQEETTQQQTAEQETPTVDSNCVRLHDYFRKSRALIVGLANSRTQGDETIDIQAERAISRNLLHQARLLKQQPLDSRSERLINDMEKIFLKVANSDESPELEIIRGGIERENLLYKIRRAEATYKTSPVMFAKY